MKKVLALNRGEIAIRILRAANELKLRTVAVYSQEDRLSLHRFKADEAYLIGEGKGPVQAYLDVDGIVALAKEKHVDAIHPGYGFLAENPALPVACEKAGITFIGPSAELLELLGDKTAARNLAIKAGIRVVPGTPEAVLTSDDAQKIAGGIGYPLIVKAVLAGADAVCEWSTTRANWSRSWPRRAKNPARLSGTTLCFWSATSSGRDILRSRS
jgi:pyruvate carboxylase